MSKTLSVSERVCAAKTELGPVPKSAFNQHGKYSYASVDDVYHAVRPVMGRHGLDLHIDLTEKTIVESAKGTPWVHLTAQLWLDGEAEKVTRYLALPLTGPQTFEAAVSYLAKQFLRQRLEIETGEYDEADMPKETPPAAPREPRKPSLPGFRIEIDAFGQVECAPPMPDPESAEFTVWAREAAKAAVLAIEASDQPALLAESAQVAELIAALPEAGQKWVRSKLPEAAE